MDSLITKVFDDCKKLSFTSATLALQRIYKVWEDKDCEDEDDFGKSIVECQHHLLHADLVFHIFNYRKVTGNILVHEQMGT